MLAGYVIGDALLTNVDYEKAAAYLDPFGIRTFSYITRYWTVSEKNTLSVGLSGMMLWNRLLWLFVAGLIFLFAYSRFSFAERAKKVKAAPKDETARLAGAIALPQVHFHDAAWTKFIASLKIHFLGVVKSTAFIVILLAALLNCVQQIALNSTSGYGNSTFPVTYWIIDIVRGTLYLFLVTVITYYAGVLAWKDREVHMDEIFDSLPAPE